MKRLKLLIGFGLVLFFIIISAGCVTPTTSNQNQFEIFQNGLTEYKTPIVEEGDQVAVYFTTNIGPYTTFIYASTDFEKNPPLRITADSKSAIVDNDYSFSTGKTTFPYAIYSAEKNAIAKSLIGKNYGDTISVSSKILAPCKITAAELKAIGHDIKGLKIGEIIPMTFAYTDSNGKTAGYLRNGVVTAIENDMSGITANFGSDTIDVIIVGKYAE